VQCVSKNKEVTEMSVLNHKKILRLDKPNLSNALLNSIVLLEARTSIKMLIEFGRKSLFWRGRQRIGPKDIEFNISALRRLSCG